MNRRGKKGKGVSRVKSCLTDSKTVLKKVKFWRAKTAVKR
jgi:hypothetical protein